MTLITEKLALLPPPPRRVRGLLAGGGSGWFFRIFMTPHTLVGIGAFAYLILTVLWILFGRDIQGVVTDADMADSSKGRRSYTVHYNYKIGAETKSGSQGVGLVEYERLSGPQDYRPPVMVRYFSLGPFHHAEIDDGGSLWRGVWLFALWVAGWNTGVGIFVYIYWIKPLRVRQLYKHGDVAPGTLIGKRVQKGRGSTYFVSYTFRDPLTGMPIEAEIQVGEAVAWANAWNGEPITVLYAAGNPKRSTVYEYGGYKVDAGLGSS